VTALFRRRAILAAALPFAASTAAALSIDAAAAGRMALDRSAELRSLENQASAAACTLKLGFRDCFPQVSLGYLDSSNVVTLGPDASSIQWTLSVKQPLFDGGRSTRQHRLAEADLDLQKRGIEDKKREILSSVDSAYSQVLMLKRKIAAQNDTLAIADQELAIARAQQSLGSLREIDLLESELQRGSLAISIQSSEAELEESEFNLRLLLGLGAGAELDLVDDFDSLYGGMDLSEDALSLGALVLEGNLELRQRQAELRKKLAVLIEARAWYLPTVSLEGGLSLSGAHYPLQSASLNGKLVFEIPAPASPLGFSVSKGASLGKQRAEGSSIDFSPLQELSAFMNSDAAMKEYALMRRRIEDMEAALEFQIKHLVAAYLRDKASLKLQRGDLALQRKKAEIQKKLLDIGEATRVDYFKTLVTTAESESAILESVLKLHQSERGLERLLGLDRGGLARFCGALSARRN
jgi:outer membrane protein TolC